MSFDHDSGSQNSRIGIGGNIWTADALLCGIIQQTPGMPRPLKDTACDLIAQLIRPLTSKLPFIPPEYKSYVPSDTKKGMRRAGTPRRRLQHRRRPVDDRAPRRWCHEAAGPAGWPRRPRGAVLLSGCDFDGAYDLPLPGSPVDEDDSFEVSADFADVLNVVPRSPVMVDDVVVGEVTEVERVGWHARVTLRVKNDVVLPDNAVAEIRQVSLLGEKYVALEAPPDEESDGTPRGRRHDRPRRDRTQPRGRGGARRAVVPAERRRRGPARHDHPRGQPGDVRAARTGCGRCSARSRASSARWTSRRPTSSTRWSRSTTWPATLNAEKDTIGEALDAVGPAVEVLADQHDELIDMLSALDRLGEVGTRVINASKEDVLSMLDDLEPILSGLQRRRPQARRPASTCWSSFPFPKAANSIVQGDYADTIARVEIDFAQPLRSRPACPTSSSPTRARSSTRSAAACGAAA